MILGRLDARSAVSGPGRAGHEGQRTGITIAAAAITTKTKAISNVTAQTLRGPVRRDNVRAP